MERSPLSHLLAGHVRGALDDGRRVDVAYPITNGDRTIGATVSGLIATRHGDLGLPADSVRIRLAGTAGQSLGAFLAEGVSIHLDGPANDYVGKGMGGGSVVVVPARPNPERIPQAAGNAVLYGATGGTVHLAGRVGQRFAVRNSGAVAVVEGISDHGCEYMTGGIAVVIGPVGRNFAAGMTGGTAYVWDPGVRLNALVAESAPSMQRLSEADEAIVSALLASHLELTDSPTARMIIDDWDRQRRRFWAVAARTSERVDERPWRAIAGVAEQSGHRTR